MDTYFQTLRVGDENAIRWYLENASKEMWSVRTLNRNISSQYFNSYGVNNFKKKPPGRKK